MNLDKLMAWVVAVVLLFSGTGNLDVLQKWVWKKQAKVIYESRSSIWGGPRFFHSKH
jgi:hypothetical protein